MDNLCDTFDESLTFGNFDSGFGSNSSSSFNQSPNVSSSENDSTTLTVGPLQIDVAPGDSELPCMRINGRKVYGPPSNWIGQPPNTCELFVKHIPRAIDEVELLNHFRRIGCIYEFRLLVDFKNENRGFAYLRYVDEASTSMAIELLNHFYVRPNRKLTVERSYDKCSLFIGNISKLMSRSEIETELFSRFPELSRVVIAPIDPRDFEKESVRNGGFVFMDFPTHNAAVRAKQQTSTGRCRLWDRDVKILWAYPKEPVDEEVMSKVTTVYVGNLEMSVTHREIYGILSKYVQRNEISKVARNREVCFITLFNREKAQHVFNCLQGLIVKNRELIVKWGTPPKNSSLHATITVDYDAQLRLMCIANNWMAPLFLFGRIFGQEQVMSVAVTIGHPEKPVTIFMEHCFTADLQARAAEIVVELITMDGGIPEFSYVVKVEADTYHIVGYVNMKPQYSWFQQARDLPNRPPLLMFVHEIFELFKGMEFLLQFQREDLKALHAKYVGRFILPHTHEHRVFGCLWRDHRKFTELRYGSDQSQLLFVLCHANTGSNYLGIAAQRFILMSECNAVYVIPYKVGTLMKHKSDHNVPVRQTLFFIRPTSGMDNFQPMQSPSSN